MSRPSSTRQRTNLTMPTPGFSFFRVEVRGFRSDRAAWAALVEAGDTHQALELKASEVATAQQAVRDAGGEPAVKAWQISSVWEGMDPNGFIRPL